MISNICFRRRKNAQILDLLSYREMTGCVLSLTTVRRELFLVNWKICFLVSELRCSWEAPDICHRFADLDTESYIPSAVENAIEINIQVL